MRARKQTSLKTSPPEMEGLEIDPLVGRHGDVYVEVTTQLKMGSKSVDYWVMTWLGLVGNVIALPIIGQVAFTNPDLRVVNISMAFGIAWPAAVVGIVAAAGLLAQRQWAVILAIVALSMSLASALPYAIVRLLMVGDFVQISGLSILLAVINLLALIYWCRPVHRWDNRL